MAEKDWVSERWVRQGSFVRWRAAGEAQLIDAWKFSHLVGQWARISTPTTSTSPIRIHLSVSSNCDLLEFLPSSPSTADVLSPLPAGTTFLPSSTQFRPPVCRSLVLQPHLHHDVVECVLTSEEPDTYGGVYNNWR